MMSKSHFWVVCDAVAFIRQHGNAAQKAALQTFEIAYGQNKLLEDVPAGQTAVERLVGFESLHTDKFGDLALVLKSIPGGTKTNVTGLGFHMFTAFNHFINPYPDTDQAWPNASGYSYTTSSMKGFDSLVVRGISKHLRGLVDVENSLVIERIKTFWNDGEHEWKENFDRDLSRTKFAPWNVLARFYHSRLLCNHYEPLEVRGPNKNIVGLQIVGPLVHAAADACSVQHVRSTLGFGHTVWENYLKAKVYNREINANAKLVAQFLSEEPFHPSPLISEGPLVGMFDAGQFISRLAAKTADRLQKSTAQSWTQLWNAGDKFWRSYLLGVTMRDDSQYFYNMAVAATVHVMVNVYEDLVKRQVLSPREGLLCPEKMPKLEHIQDQIPGLPTKKTMEDLPSEQVMPVPFSQPWDILGFVPVGATRLQEFVNEAAQSLSRITHVKMDQQKMNRVFKNIEQELLEQYRRMADRAGEDFCPLRAVEKLPLDSDLSGHFGTGTYRMPSSEECDDPRLLEKYIDLSDAHSYKANKLQITQLIAGLTFYRNKFATQPEVVRRIDNISVGLEQLRGLGKNDAAAEAFDLVEPRSAEKQSVRQPMQTPGMAVWLTEFFSGIREWFAPVFRVPVTALATAAALVLLIVVMLPHGEPEPVVGLSGEKWEKPRLTLMSPKSLETEVIPSPTAEKQRIAFIVRFKNFKKPLSQEVIDAAYSAVRPTPAIQREYDVVSPDKLREAADKNEIGSRTDQELLDGAAKKLGLSRVLIFTVTAKGDRFEVESELKNLATGEGTTAPPEKGISNEDLPASLRKSLESHFANQ